MRYGPGVGTPGETLITTADTWRNRHRSRSGRPARSAQDSAEQCAVLRRQRRDERQRQPQQMVRDLLRRREALGAVVGPPVREVRRKLVGRFLALRVRRGFGDLRPDAVPMARWIEEVPRQDVVLMVLGAVEEAHEVSRVDEPRSPRERCRAVQPPRVAQRAHFIRHVCCGRRSLGIADHHATR